MRNLLVIGGDALSAYVDALEADGFQVTRRASGEPVTAEEFDLVVLEAGAIAEDPSARALLEAAQTGDGAPVIAFLRLDQLSQYDPARGIDDFIVDGAPAPEISARVAQILWRRHKVDARSILKLGDLAMDLQNYTVHVAGRRVDLTYKEYELLRFLATNKDRVFSRETLLSKVWGYDFYGGARTVDVHIRRLRSKIEDRHNTFIETVRNVGYRFRA
jgi:DNA-binding response OmpR family regulator